MYRQIRCKNDLTKNGVIQLHNFKEVEHPTILPNFQNAFEWSMPTVFSCVSHIFKHFLRL